VICQAAAQVSVPPVMPSTSERLNTRSSGAKGRPAVDPATGIAGAKGRTDGPAVVVDPVHLTDVAETLFSGLNLGVVVGDEKLAAGIQKAADVWGFQADLFVTSDVAERRQLLQFLVDNKEAVLLFDQLAGEDFSALKDRITAQTTPAIIFSDDALVRTNTTLGNEKLGLISRVARTANPSDDGFRGVQIARSQIISRIPKFDEIFPIAFPISPVPDSFFAPTKFPYPEPLVRSDRTSSSVSASAHAHTSCSCIAKTGNMLHRTSPSNPQLMLMGMEGGNLALKALPGAVDPAKLAAIMTSWVIAVRGQNMGEDRDVLVENDGLASSFFKPAVHAPEEVEQVLGRWKEKGLVRGFKRLSDDEILLEGYRGADRRMRAGLFMVSSDKVRKEPELLPGFDSDGRLTLDFYSTQRFIQQFSEIPADEKLPAVGAGVLEKASLDELSPSSSGVPMPGEPLLPMPRKPRGGLLTEGGTSTGRIVGFPLGSMLYKVADAAPHFQPYVLAVEGGFLVVTFDWASTEVRGLDPHKSPETQLAAILSRKIVRLDLDLRGMLTSDQTIAVSLEDGSRVVFRRTTLNFGELDEALQQLQDQALVSGWEYVGERGRGLAANVVLLNFLGKHRKFMSSLNTWPNEQRPQRPTVRFYVDGMQRLNFTLITRSGWRQEFVEVPLRIPPVPRDVELYAGQATLR